MNGDQPTRVRNSAARAGGFQLILLHPASYRLLTDALDAAVAQNAALAPARTMVLEPLHTLETLAQDASGALGDDVIAGERLRLLISLVEPQAPTASVVSSMLSGTGAAGLSSATAGTHIGVPCSPAVIDLGALVIVGLAAGRVGAERGLSDPMISNVLALALAAGPAEALTRALAAGMTTAQLGAALSGISSRDGNRAVSATMATFLADGCERMRWSCIAALFTEIRRDVAGTQWDGAGDGSLVDVTPATACTGNVVTLQLDPDPPEGAPLSSTHFLPLLAARAAFVVFASQGERSRARRARSVDVEKASVEVIVPAGAHPGWIGFTDPDTLRASNDSRARLRAAWQERNKAVGCLRNSPVPTDAIPLLRRTPTPPRTPDNRFAGGAPLIVHASLEPAVVDIRGMAELQWRIDGSRTVVIEPGNNTVESTGRETFAVTDDHALIERTIVARNDCGEEDRARLRIRVRTRITELRFVQNERETPLVAGRDLELRARVVPSDARGQAVVAAGSWSRTATIENGRISVTIPDRLVQNGLVGTLRVNAANERIDDQRDFGPFQFVELQQRTVVVVRPASLGRAFRRVGATDVHTALDRVAGERAFDVTVLEPAWVDDADLSWPGPIEGPQTPAVDHFLQRLNLLAARTPGLEQALWLAIVPGPPRGTGFHRIEPADGAVAVAVCTPDRLDALLAEELPQPGALTDRLRIIGTLSAEGTVRLEALRMEKRMAGPGGLLPTGLAITALAGESQRTQQCLLTVTDNRPAAVIALLPVSDDIDQIQLRNLNADYARRLTSALDLDSQTVSLPIVRRTSGVPELSKLKLKLKLKVHTLSWQYHHTHSARSSFSIEVGRNGSWGPILLAGGCEEEAEVPLERVRVLTRADRIRVVASDGWNSAAAPVDGVPLPPLQEHRAIARFDGRNTFWADVDFDGGEFDPDVITWTFGRKRSIGAQLTLPRGFAGKVTLTVEAPGDTLFDYREIGADGQVDRRDLQWPQEGRRV